MNSFEKEQKASSINPNNAQILNLKTSNSYNVILQIDLYSKVFLPLLNDNVLYRFPSFQFKKPFRRLITNI